MSNLHRIINAEKEEEFQLGSMNFFRRPLKQIGNSVNEIKTHYMSNDAVTIIPTMCPPHLAGIQTSLLRHLDRDSFLFKKNIVTGSAIDSTGITEVNGACLLVLMDSLALVMDFEIPPRPSDVLCDILLAICGQPVIVLTLVDGDKDSKTVTMYNTSVARGVSSTLCKFMDESVNAVFGLMCQKDMKCLDTFQSLLGAIVTKSSMFLPSNTLATKPSKYEKIVTAFWAGVAETKSVISEDGQVDTDYLRFLTKDQCIILMENINNREVKVQFQSGTGATTLMVEVARRLAKLGQTLLVCRSGEEKQRLRIVCASCKTVSPGDFSSVNLSSFQHVVDETGRIENKTGVRLWRFIRAEDSGAKENESEQQAVMMETEEISKDFECKLEENADTGVSLDTNCTDVSLPFLRKRFTTMEEEFHLGSMNFFRPPLKQIRNSISEIKTHYMADAGVLNVIPSTCPSHLAIIKNTLLKHLEKDSFMWRNNIVTGSTMKNPAPTTLLVLMDSLALAMDIKIPPRPSDVLCDILLATCGQPVIVLTLVDGDKDSETVTMYNTSVARGVSSTLCKFMDESVNAVFGVLCQKDIENLNTFRASIEAIVTKSAMFLPLSTLSTTPSKYGKIVTAFWAGVAETKSVLSKDGPANTDFLRFLTKDQCIILMENINNREVEVQFQPGTGATTLMVEVARRLAKVDETLLLCRFHEKERITALFPNTKTAADLRSCDLLKLTNVVNGTGIPLTQTGGRIWTFTKDPPVVDELQKDMNAFENLVDRTRKLTDLLSDDDKREKMKYLFGQFETLKFLDIIIRCLILLNSLSNSVAFEFRPVYRYSPGGDKNQRLETRDFLQHVMGQLKHGLKKRMDLFPLLGDVFKQVMFPVPCLKAESESQWDATSKRPSDSKKSEADITVDQDICLGVWEPVEQAGGMDDTTGTKSPDMQLELDTSSKVIDSEKITRIPKLLIAETQKEDILKRIDAQENWIEIVDDLSHGGAGTRITDIAAAGITADQSKPTGGHLDQVVEAGQEHKTTHETKPSVEMADTSQVINATTTGELKARLKELEKEASRQQEKIRDLTDATDHLVDWENNMECLSQQMATIGIQDVLTDIIGQDEIPVSGEQPRSASFDGDHRTRRCPKRPCLIYQLRAMEYETQKQKDLLNIVSGVITDKQRRLSHLLIQLGRLDQGPTLTFNSERVGNDRLTVSEDGLELVNWRGLSLDHRTDRFKKYRGTSSHFPIPIPPSPSTFTAATYWETHTRLQVKKDVSRWFLLEMAVSKEGKVDTDILVSDQRGSSWGLGVGGCGIHPGHVCTQVWENRRQVGQCQTDTMSPTPGTDVTLKYGIALDVGRGRLAFIDVNRGRVLHKFDVNLREALSPMFCVSPFPGYVHATMKLKSGREVAITRMKQLLVAQALFCEQK